jgi:hypothetical protein
VKAIAENLGVARETVSRELAHPETQAYIQSLLAKHDAKLERIAGKVIQRVEESLDALKSDPADHKARMLAVSRAADLLELRQGGTRHDPAGSSGASVSGDMGTILEIYARITRPQSPGA